ncbi:hypothetical protein DH2020_024051 [Rehmannia glutinosa]|uniref:PUM-HD domain-containing protein n=1 Tax=Rehmannia glutinosa TaxID=99300 RepID=A0ABR0WA22_REHGL
MKDDEELEMLLGEILNNTHLHHHNNLVDHGYGYASCVTQNMNGQGNNVHHVMYDDDDSLKHNYASPPQDFNPHSISGNQIITNSNGNNLVDCFSNMYISDGQESVSLSPYVDRSVNGTVGMSFESYGTCDNYYRNDLSDWIGYDLSVPGNSVNFPGEISSPMVEMQHNQFGVILFTTPNLGWRGIIAYLVMLDEGTSLDVQIIFNEIIDHTVELMVNPFANYLMQKILEVCSEEQRMCILIRVTEEPGQIVRISLSTHGTRVVQKLIETLKTKQQISRVISALEPGFLALINDLNGNHVIQRCLQCFPGEDTSLRLRKLSAPSYALLRRTVAPVMPGRQGITVTYALVFYFQFIFVAAAKYCVDIATHQHGCCVMQRCISHSTGEHREKLVAEISANGLLLAQDTHGNYVIQFILGLKIPCATSKLTSQFEGNYVHLSTQKCSSHVVEKCLQFCNEEVRSKIIHELLSAPYFGHLLQDPHANYVIQKALEYSEGHLQNSLIDAIASHKAISRNNSPYSKKIFSHKLLKRW